MEMRPATMDDAVEVALLLERCAAVDGRAAMSEYKALRVPVANAVRSVVSDAAAGCIVAVGVAAWHAAEIGEAGGYWAAELALDPSVRSTGRYESVLSALEAGIEAPISVWTFDAMQVRAAENHGLVETRAIVEMRRPLPAEQRNLPDGLTVRSFVEGTDETMWLLLNQKVFSHHPEAGSIDAADLALRMAQPWFDPAGLLVVFDGSEPVGYAWTKLHPGAVGEIYMIGLIPDYRGKGLARPLTLVGLDYLSAVGATSAMLYADSSNSAAIGLYESLGFMSMRRIALFEPSPPMVQ